MSLFGIVMDLLKWVFEATVQYNASEVGHAQLVDIADALEAAGFDIPFFDPTPAGSPLDFSDVPLDATATDVQFAQAFRTRHPELFPQEGSQ